MMIYNTFRQIQIVVRRKYNENFRHDPHLQFISHFCLAKI